MRLVKDAIVASLVSSTLSFRVMFRFQKLGKGESEKGGGGQDGPKNLHARSKADDGELEVDSPFMEAGMDSADLNRRFCGLGRA